jgi:hypothetical protein
MPQLSLDPSLTWTIVSPWLTGFGLPQRRRRVFILASLHGNPRRGTCTRRESI